LQHLLPLVLSISAVLFGGTVDKARFKVLVLTLGRILWLQGVQFGEMPRFTPNFYSRIVVLAIVLKEVLAFPELAPIVEVSRDQIMGMDIRQLGNACRTTAYTCLHRCAG
jgi:hypothetical protein